MANLLTLFGTIALCVFAITACSSADSPTGGSSQERSDSSPEADQDNFVGRSFHETDSFTGETATVLEGLHESSGEGFALSCIAETPYVLMPSGVRPGSIVEFAYITPDTVGAAESVTVYLREVRVGDSAPRSGFHWHWGRLGAPKRWWTGPEAFVDTLVNKGTATIRFAGSTGGDLRVDFSGVSTSKHWSFIQHCGSSDNSFFGSFATKRVRLALSDADDIETVCLMELPSADQVPEHSLFFTRFQGNRLLLSIGGKSLEDAVGFLGDFYTIASTDGDRTTFSDAGDPMIIDDETVPYRAASLTSDLQDLVNALTDEGVVVVRFQFPYVASAWYSVGDLGTLEAWEALDECSRG